MTITALAFLILAALPASADHNRTDEQGRKQGHWVEVYMDYTDLSAPHEHRGEGSYVDGKRQGHWVERHTDGSAVGEGPYMDDKKQGHWIERFADGSVQEGPYVNDKAHGYWVARGVDGTLAQGSYVNGKMHGHWVLRNDDSDVEKGHFVDDKRHGQWVLRRANGDVIKMCYESGDEVDCSVSVNPKFVVEGEILHYNTELAPKAEEREIRDDDLDYFDKVLKENPNIKVVYLTSWGGDVEAANEIASLIIDYELNTHTVDICFSACPTIFLGGEKRTLQRGSKIGFHRSWWPIDGLKAYYEDNKETEGWKDVFSFAAWVHEYTQDEIYRDFRFLLERGVAPLFAIETLQEGPEGGWYPRRKELREANFLTE